MYSTSPHTRGRIAAVGAICLFVFSLMNVAVGQPNMMRDDAAPIAVKAGHLLDPASGDVVDEAVIVIEGERIVASGAGVDIPDGAQVIDLSDYYVLPGLIDAHTHLLIQPDYAEVNPILYKSIPYRALEAANAAKKTLEAGFTSIRDVDSEGADWADVAVRDAIDTGLIPGPRMQVATRALSITGGYMNQNGLAPQIDVPQFGHLADSRDELVAEVRREVKYGADLIKLYATGTTTNLDLEHMEPLAQFNYDDMKLVVDEARRFRLPVAAHAYGGQAAYDAVRAGVRSIEHGFLLDDKTMDLMKERGTFWVPTLTVYVPTEPQAEWDERSTAIVAAHEDAFRRGLDHGLKIAFGTDAGAIPHGDNAIEFERMVSYGMAPLDAIRAATSVAADLMQRSDDVGSLAPGHFADVIAVSANPLDDVSTLRDVRFVMKGGAVVVPAN